MIPDYSLADKNTLAVPASCAFYESVNSLTLLQDLVVFANEENLSMLVLGGGSNLVLTQDFAGLVVRIDIRGRILVAEHEEDVLLEIGAGEEWHDLVRWTLEQGWYGLENLALIPGRVGAAPIQNIGAYGVELEKFVYQVQVLDRDSGEVRWMGRQECGFGYRDSVFKNELKDKVIVTAIRLKLSKRFASNLDYPALADRIQKRQQSVTAMDVFNAVCEIRTSKLPDPAQIPNVGSFFKNPVVSAERFEQIQIQVPDLVGYPAGTGSIKIPAAQLIDQLGWKGFMKDGVGVHDRQALVLVNPGKCSGRAVVDLAQRISDSVRAEYGVELEIEPTVM